MSDESNQNLLLELYKINDNYHNTKDNLVWISASAYFTLTAPFIIWYFSLTQGISCRQKMGLTIVFVVFSLFFFLYVMIQNFYKARSVAITNNLNKLLENNAENLVRSAIVQGIRTNYLHYRYRPEDLLGIQNYLKSLQVPTENKTKSEEVANLLETMIEQNSKKYTGRVCKYWCLYWRNGVAGAILSVSILIVGTVETLLLWF